MTDSNATERIDKLIAILEERGASYEVHDIMTNKAVTWEGDVCKWVALDDDEGLAVAVYRDYLTPEQAIAATLGCGTCEIVASSTDGLCTDSPRHWFKLSCGHSFTVDGLERPMACAVCGKAVKR